MNDIIGSDETTQKLRERIAQVGPTPARVLITGENGTGKELVARALHAASSRADKPLIIMNCAAVPESLIESELFGHEKGAFTGAIARQVGKFEAAHGGTLFLDEVGDMPHAMQAKLLRALQQGEITRVGSRETFKVDVRVIAATNKNLETEVQQGRFREDLYYRLNVVRIKTPPLRERPNDIPELLHYFLDRMGERHSMSALPIINHQVMRLLLRQPFPGNIRELENLAERIVVLYPSGLHLADLAELLDTFHTPVPAPAPAPAKACAGTCVKCCKPTGSDKSTVKYCLGCCSPQSRTNRLTRIALTEGVVAAIRIAEDAGIGDTAFVRRLAQSLHTPT